MQVQTVLGPVSPSSLGHTLTHEHCTVEFSLFYIPPPSNVAEFYEGEITVGNAGFIRQMPYSSRNNVSFFGPDTNRAVLNDVALFKRFGGGTIVENTTFGLGGNVSFLKSVSAATSVNIVAGTGYYVADTQDTATLALTAEQLYNNMRKEMVEGFDVDPTIKAGFMGEIASVRPIHPFEKRVLQAVGQLQEELGCGVSFHPHREPESPFEVLRLYLEAGGRADKAVMSHLDRTLLNDETLLEFSNLGCYCQFDLFGIEVSTYQLYPTTDMPSDAQRIDKIKKLIDDGKADKILMSHDIHTKHRLIDYAGHGYSHIIRTVVPKMKIKGISDADIERITVTNPADWLKYNLQ